MLSNFNLTKINDTKFQFPQTNKKKQRKKQKFKNANLIFELFHLEMFLSQSLYVICPKEQSLMALDRDVPIRYRWSHHLLRIIYMSCILCHQPKSVEKWKDSKKKKKDLCEIPKNKIFSFFIFFTSFHSFKSLRFLSNGKIPVVLFSFCAVVIFYFWFELILKLKK